MEICTWRFYLNVFFSSVMGSLKTNGHCLTLLSVSDMCIASAISLLMILICGMATYGAYKVLDDSLNPKYTFYMYFFWSCDSRQSAALQFVPLLQTMSASQLSNPNLSVSAASCLDYPLFLLPNFWLCSQHVGRCEHCGLPKHHSGLPAATGERPSWWSFSSCQVCVASWWQITNGAIDFTCIISNVTSLAHCVPLIPAAW